MNKTNKPPGKIAMTLGVISFLGMIAWPILMIVGASLSGMGDGAPSGPLPTALKTALIAGVPALYLLLIFLNCLPFMQGKQLRNTGIVAHLILAAFIFPSLLKDEPGTLFILVVFGVFAGGWLLVYFEKAEANTPAHRHS